MTGLLDDIRLGSRALGKRPGLTVVAVLTLGLGIGTSTTLYTVFLPQVYEMPPVRDPDRLSLLLKVNPTLGIERGRPSLSEYLDWRNDTRSYEALAAIHESAATLTVEGGTRRVSAHRVTANFFDTLGVKPTLGRTFRPDETASGAPPVAIISHDLWRGVFQQDPAVLGRTIDLDDEPHVIVGVMPEGFWFVISGIEIWTPLALQHESAVRSHVMIVGRRKPGAAWEQAQAEIDTLTQRTSPRDVAAGWRTAVVPMPKEAMKRVRVMPVAFMPALLVLLIGCVNVANLLLASGVAREHEMAVRTAIGATRRRLVRQLLTESAWLAVGGGILGFLVVFWGVELFRSVLGRSQPLYAARIVITPSVFAVALLMTVATPLIFGLAPALRASSPKVGELLKDSPRGERLVRGYRLRDLLVPLELALAMILLVTTGLFLRFFWELQHVPTGFDDRRLYVVAVSSSISGRAAPNLGGLHGSLLEQVRGVPGIEAAALAVDLPAVAARGSRLVTLDEATGAPSAGELTVVPIDTSPGFFATTGIPLHRGRDFSSDDGLGGAPVAILSEHLARRWWPDQDPIGKTFRLGGSDAPAGPVTVVGVAGDVMTSDKLQSPYIYLPLSQTPSRRVLVVTRVIHEPPDLAALKQAVARVAPLKLDEVWSVRERLANQFRGGDFALWFFGVFAGLALLLAAIGVYTVTSQAVGRRTREIGIRLALGASRGDVLRAIFGPTLTLSAVGIALGVAGTLVVTRITFSLLIDISATAPIVWILIIGALTAAGLTAVLVPARRALGVDPAVALRQN